MKHCPSCYEPYGDEPVFCELDGTHLVEGPQTAADAGLSAPAPHAPRAGRVIDLKTLSVGLTLGILVCIATLAFFGLTRRGGGGQEKLPEPSKAADQTATAPPRRSSYELTPAESPTPEATPIPTATPAPTAAVASRPPGDGLDTLSDSPATIGNASGRGERRLAIHLNDGFTVTAEDAWRAPEGVWYRQGGIVALLQRSRIRSVERLPVPKPSPSSQ